MEYSESRVNYARLISTTVSRRLQPSVALLREIPVGLVCAHGGAGGAVLGPGTSFIVASVDESAIEPNRESSVKRVSSSSLVAIFSIFFDLT